MQVCNEFALIDSAQEWTYYKVGSAGVVDSPVIGLIHFIYKSLVRLATQSQILEVDKR